MLLFCGLALLEMQILRFVGDMVEARKRGPQVEIDMGHEAVLRAVESDGGCGRVGDPCDQSSAEERGGARYIKKKTPGG